MSLLEDIEFYRALFPRYSISKWLCLFFATVCPFACSSPSLLWLPSTPCFEKAFLVTDSFSPLKSFSHNWNDFFACNMFLILMNSATLRRLTIHFVVSYRWKVSTEEKMEMRFACYWMRTICWWCLNINAQSIAFYRCATYMWKPNENCHFFDP